MFGPVGVPRYGRPRGFRLQKLIPGQESVFRVRSCELQLKTEAWGFAEERAGEIAEHWRRRQSENPDLFDGRVLMMLAPAIMDDVLRAELLATDFKAYLFWRESGFPDAEIFDGFGSALVRSVEGHVLLGRQRGGNINSGLAYLPGGFIDERDVGSGGNVDIGASIARELTEETGLCAEDLLRPPGFFITRFRSQISIAQEFRSDLTSEALRAKILAAIAKQDDPELDDIVTVTKGADLKALNVGAYVQLLLPEVL